MAYNLNRGLKMQMCRDGLGGHLSNLNLFNISLQGSFLLLGGTGLQQRWGIILRLLALVATFGFLWRGLDMANDWHGYQGVNRWDI